MVSRSWILSAFSIPTDKFWHCAGSVDRIDALQAQVEALTQERDALLARLDDINVKDRVKTQEINLLVAEVRDTVQRAEQAEARVRELEQALLQASRAPRAVDEDDEGWPGLLCP